MAKAVLKVVDNHALLNQIRDERDRLAEFVKYIMEKIWDHDDLEAWDCQAKALELELIVENEMMEENDPEQMWYTEPGASSYHYSSWLEEIEPVTGTY